MMPRRLPLLAACASALLFSPPQPVRRRVAHFAAVELEADENEVLLGELIFSSRDPRIDVATSPESYGEEFCAFVLDKAEKAEDMEERVALKSLVDMIQAVQLAVKEEERRLTRENARVVEDDDVSQREDDAPKRTDAELLASAQSIVAPQATAVKEKATKEAEAAEKRTEAGLSGAALETYEKLLVKFKTADNLMAAVEANFDFCDYSFLALAAAREEKEVVDAVNDVAARNLQMATQRLQSVLKAGAPEKMFQRIVELAAIGAIDRAFLELLEANRQQAETAGAHDAADFMKRLADRGKAELDKAYEPEKKLLRALLRCAPADDAGREALIRAAFEPKESIALGFDGAATQGGVDVEPPKFINACQRMIADFGNLDDAVGLDDDDDDSGNLADRVRAIADQAEAIAIELFGDNLSPKEQQDKVWNEATTSVFDLEAAELAAESQGERMPWQDDSYDDMLPPGFDQAGVKKIGGG